MVKSRRPNAKSRHAQKGRTRGRCDRAARNHSGSDAPKSEVARAPAWLVVAGPRLKFRRDTNSVLPCAQAWPATASANAKTMGGTGIGAGGVSHTRTIPLIYAPLTMRRRRSQRRAERPPPPASSHSVSGRPVSASTAATCQSSTKVRIRRPSALKQTCDTGLSCISGWVMLPRAVPNPGRSVQRPVSHAAAIRTEDGLLHRPRMPQFRPNGFPVRASQHALCCHWKQRQR